MLNLFDKSSWIALLGILLVTSSSAWAEEGIQFHKGSWEEALESAKNQNKTIFIDAYAVWCGPCKMMEKDVFVLPEVASYYNNNFINYKLDVDIEIELAEKFKIEAMPTFLFADAEGNVIYQRTGALSSDGFLNLGKEALEIPKLEKRYKEGDRDPEFVKEYLLTMGNRQDSAIKKLGREFLEKLPKASLLEEDHLQLMQFYLNDSQHPIFSFFLENFTAYYDLNPDLSNDFVYSVLDKLYVTGVEEKEASSIKRMVEIISQIDPVIPEENTQEVIDGLWMSYYQDTEQWTNFAEKSINYTELYGSDNYDMVLNNAMTFYYHVENDAHLQKALGWLNDLEKQDDNFALRYVRASLLSKLGNQDEALSEAQKAKNMAPAESEYLPLIEDLIAKIQK